VPATRVGLADTLHDLFLYSAGIDAIALVASLFTIDGLQLAALVSTSVHNLRSDRLASTDW
jgi:hypothetical protein